jgi:hypothetical protein
MITKGFTDGLNPLAFDSSCHIHRRIYRRDIFGRYFIHSPTTLPTDWIRRHFTVVATITDEFIDGYIRSVFQTLIDQFTDGT